MELQILQEVALNCVANGKILKGIFENVWIQPAAGDAWSLVALGYWYQDLNMRVINKDDEMKGSFLGPNLIIKNSKS